ncbi:MAG: aminotransferase class V-fold PLP-dependent enzyme [Chryseolinea sp.]
MRNTRINFTPGPSQLYFTVEDHIKAAFREGVPSLSHRSKQFETIYKEASDGLRELLGIPAAYHIFFTGSATEIWERSIQNLVADSSFHLVNGAFSKRFFEIALQLKKSAHSVEVDPGKGFSGDLAIPSGTDLIAVTHNETSTGVSLSPAFISSLRSRNPDALLVIDAVSSLPYPDFDYNAADSVFFSVQKGFGLPAGLGVWMVNDRCIERSEQLLSRGLSIGSYHTLPALLANEKKFQTPETPNVLGIYLLGKVIADMNRRGVGMIRKETEYKSLVLYDALDKRGDIKPFVADKAHRSATVIVAETGHLTEKVRALLQENGLDPGDGYGAAKKTQLRFANFPTHAREYFELIADTLAKL